MPKRLLYILISIFFTTISFADTIAPVSTPTLNPATPNGNNSWYKTPVEVTINSTDIESGIKDIYYKTNANNWIQKTFYQTLNLAPNPSFEDNLDKWALTVDDNYIVALPDYTTAYLETVSAKLTSTGVGWHAIDHMTNFAVVDPYSTVTMSAWIKTENISQLAYFKMYSVALDQNNNLVKTYLGQSNTITGTNSWTKISKSVTLSTPNSIGVFMEVGLEGTGTLWVDGVNINKSATQQQVKLYLSVDGTNTLQYYSVDQAGNIETVKTLTLKIDQTPPGNWAKIEINHEPTDREYEIMISTDVEDATSGLSSETRYFQYKVLSDYGSYKNLMNCSTEWQSGAWEELQIYPQNDGSNTTKLKTKKVSFCDNVWNTCKAIRFKAYDLAGNTSTKEYCINGPWITTVGGGKVKANHGIDMMVEANGTSNTDGIIEVGTDRIEFFTTSVNYKARYLPKLKKHSYQDFWDTTKDKTTTTSVEGNSGLFYINGNYIFDTVPASLNGQTYSQIVFISGDLTINTDITIPQASTLLFIVKGDVKISKQVQNVQAAIFTDNTIYTAYDIVDGDETLMLEMKGVFAADKFVLQRGRKKNETTTERFVYEPKYLLKMRAYTTKTQVEWIN